MGKIDDVIINQRDHPEICKWLLENIDDYQNNRQVYSLTSDGKINAYCDIFFKKHVSVFKYPFGAVNGCFSCYDCKNLTSLIGSPETVGGYFDCSDCYKLTSLIGSPKKVGEYFSCYRNIYILSLIGLPKEVGNDIYIEPNKFSIRQKSKRAYKPYLAMWLELFESVSNEERIEYITNYKDKKQNGNPIIPIEIMKEYGF